MTELNSIDFFEKIIFDYKDSDPNDKSIIVRVDMRVFLSENRILGLRMDIPPNYP